MFSHWIWFFFANSKTNFQSCYWLLKLHRKVYVLRRRIQGGGWVWGGGIELFDYWIHKISNLPGRGDISLLWRAISPPGHSLSLFSSIRFWFQTRKKRQGNKNKLRYIYIYIGHFSLTNSFEWMNECRHYSIRRKGRDFFGYLFSKKKIIKPIIYRLLGIKAVVRSEY